MTRFRWGLHFVRMGYQSTVIVVTKPPFSRAQRDEARLQKRLHIVQN